LKNDYLTKTGRWPSG